MWVPGPLNHGAISRPCCQFFFLKIILYVLSSTDFLIQQYTSEIFLNNRNEQVHLPQ